MIGASARESQIADAPTGQGWIKLSESVHMCNLQPLIKGANVYKGKLKRGGEWRDVAIKLIPHTAADVKESSFLLKLDSHPNIIQIFDTGEIQGIIPHIYIAMEFCSQSLKDFIDEHQQSPFDFQQNFDFAKQIVCGVAFIHKHNILHRDIKLENILLSPTKENVRVTNFGLSTQVRDGYSDITASTRGVGTDGYRAPELLHEKPTASFRSDSFSIGIVLAMLFSKGHHPFGPDPARWRTNISDNKGRDLSHIVAFPEPHAHKREQLVDLIDLCLMRKATRRPTPQEMLEHEFFVDNPEPALAPEYNEANRANSPTKVKESITTEEETQSSEEAPKTEVTNLSNEARKSDSTKVMKQESEPESSLLSRVTSRVRSFFTVDLRSVYKKEPAPEFNEAKTSILPTEVKESATTEREIQPSAESLKTETTDLSAKVTEGNDAEERLSAVEFDKTELAESETRVTDSRDTGGPQQYAEAVKVEAAGLSTRVKKIDSTIELGSAVELSKSEATESTKLETTPSTESKSGDAGEGPLEQFLKAKNDKIKHLESKMATSLREGGFEHYSKILKELTNLRNSDDLDVAVQLTEYELMSKKNDTPIVKLRNHLSSTNSWTALDVRKLGLELHQQGQYVQAFILFKVCYDVHKGETTYASESELAWIHDSIIAMSSAITALIENGGWCVVIAKRYGVKYAEEMFKDLRAVNVASPGVKALREIAALVSITGNALRSQEREKCVQYGEEGVAMMKRQFGENVIFYKDYGGVLNNLGNAYDQLGQYVKAVECYNDALGCVSVAQDYDDEGGRQNHIKTTKQNLQNTNGKILRNPT